MRSYKNLLIPIVFILIVFAAAYSLIMVNYESSNLFAQDSTDNFDPPPGDVSQMFNERGFYKSNSFSPDGNEIINDFNGNLIYDIPLYSLKGAGDINLEVKLTYNGSVGHQIELCDSVSYWGTTSQPYRYNINQPEWILSVNGIGVQVLNFETRMLTKPSNNENYPITGNDVKKLIPGYHFDDKMYPLGNYEKDKIYILSGDGSSLTLINKHPEPYDEDVYAGNYHSDAKGTNYRAYVTYIEGGTNHYARDRQMELMMGDGLIYIFKEVKLKYEDVDRSDPQTIRTPQTMLLQEIRDRFGNKIVLNYEINSSLKGRPRLISIGLDYEDITIDYPETGNGIVLENNIHKYKLRFGNPVTYGLWGNKYGLLTSIVDPTLQQSTITYQGYQRKLTGVPSNRGYSTQTILCNNLKRIKEFKNFLGGKHVYEYLDRNDFCAAQVCLEIVYSTSMTSYGNLASTLMKGYGRDPFYVNMVTEKNDFDEKGTEKTESVFTYTFENQGTAFNIQNIDSADNYYSTVTISSKDPITVNNSVVSNTERQYRVYPVKQYGTAYNPENIDVTAATKLIVEEFKDGSNIKEKKNYIYEIGSGGAFFTGSFLLLTLKNTVDGDKERLWTYKYKYYNDNYDSVVTEKIDVDPKNYKTHIYYATFDTTLNFLRGIAMLGTAEASYPDTISILGPKRFYKIGVDTLTRRFGNTGDRNTIPPFSGYSEILIKQTRNIYFEDTISADGYFGELKAVREFSEGSTSYFIEKNYQYYKKDTTGRYLYRAMEFPFVEGNLKLATKPDNQEERYFYYPVIKIDTAGMGLGPGGSTANKVYYKIKYADGTTEFEADFFIDRRLPTKIDNYKKNYDNSRDTIKTLFMEYNSAGNPLKIINENGYLTKLDYFPPYRIRKITLPGDFSKSIDHDSTIYYYDTVSNANEVPGTGWGKIDLQGGANSIKLNTISTDVNCSYYFNMAYNSYSGEKKLPYIKFIVPNLTSYVNIDSAMLYIAPMRLLMGVNGNYDTVNYTADVKAAYDKIGYTNWL